ncbi:MFS transporter, partial [Pseudomonas sp. 2822-15]
YFFAVRDTPKGKVFVPSKKGGAMEVSSWKDLILLILWTLPLGGALAVLAWRLEGMGFISQTVLYATYTVIGVVMLYQVYKILHVNVPILRKGVPEDDRYEFKNVAALN